VAILVADCVTKSFGSRRVLSAGSVRAERGEIRVLLGRNGVGKSTLLRIAAGCMAPDSGVVHYRDTAYLRARHATLASRGLFFLPDHDLLSSAFPLRRQLRLFEERFRRRSVAEAATLTGVAHLFEQRPTSLSGGELRRAELAAVLVRRPDCLLADEPYRGIAPVDHDALTHIFRILADDGCAVVITGHDVPVLLGAADHVTWCTSGTTYELGPPARARLHETFAREYLAPDLARDQ
jgi:ABC-type multidrug transport system ATPase subunit